MKRIIYMWLSASVLGGVLVSLAGAQSAGAQEATISNPTTEEPSLGSYARAVRKDKKQEAAKTFDNDNLPRQDKLSVVGTAAEETPASPADATQPLAASGAASDKPKMMPGQSEEDRQKVIDQWQQKLAEQNAQINSLSQALSLDQREYRVHAAEYYNDPSQRTGATGQWAKDDAAYKEKIAAEQKAVEDAKQKFGDLEEEARHSGVPNSVREAAEPQPASEAQQSESAPDQSESAPQQ
jgi:hypothetical protein